MTTHTERAVSPVVGTVAVVALVVTLAAGVFAAGLAMDSLGGSPPNARIAAADLPAACTGCGPSDQVVRLTHRGGNPIPVEEVELAVRIPASNQQARLVNLPLATNCLPDGHVEGTDIFDGGCGRVGGPVTAVGPDSDGVWSAGETVRFRLKKAAVRLAPGDEVAVRVVHAPSGTTVVTATATAV